MHFVSDELIVVSFLVIMINAPTKRIIVCYIQVDKEVSVPHTFFVLKVLFILSLVRFAYLLVTLICVHLRPS